MAITYHAGRRIQGTNDPSLNYGTVSIDGSYTVLQFTEGGVFKPTSSFNVEYLVVAGGGAGASGGAGAGGYRTSTAYPVTAQSYSITVGVGGTAVISNVTGNKGDDSSITPTSGTSIISTGGGGGGRTTLDNSSVGAGGSGGGAGVSSSGAFSGGNGNTPSTTPSQGNNGGDNAQTSSPFYSGGGGGSSGIGGDSTTSSVGAGGTGTANDIVLTSTNVTYSAGGTGSIWVGGSVGANGAVNTGNGGGGGDETNGGGDGGSGVVILRFLTSDGIFHPSTSQVGSRFEETDTRKIYHRDDIDFKEENGNEATNYRSASWYEQLSGETP